MKEILVLGAEGSGKSLVIRRVKEVSENKFDIDTASESTIPTTGVEIVNVEFTSDINCNIREIGSAMSSRWDSYLFDCCGLIYVIDISDIGFIPSAFVLLHEILSNKSILSNKPILISLNKMDIVDKAAFKLACNALRLNDLVLEWKNMQIVTGSSVTGNIAADTIKWIRSCL